jgi:endonuclease/exonuclease/phosphatase family metal-dependent hydrolase
VEDRRSPGGRCTVTVASLNLHCGVDSRGHPFDVEAAIAGLGADVIALQEAFSPARGPDPVEAAAEATGCQLLRAALCCDVSPARLGIPAGNDPGSLGIAVLCRLPVAGYQVLDLGQMHGDIVRRSALILTVELPGTGTVARFVGTHLTHRLAGPLQLARLLWHLARDPLPTVIAGDLNMPRQLARIAPGYAPAPRGRSFPADAPFVQLDHVLVSRHFERLDAGVLASVGSDHLPVRAELGLHGARSRSATASRNRPR